MIKLITFKFSFLFFIIISNILFLPFGVMMSVAQSSYISFLFKPGLNIGTEYTLPAEINDTAKFQISKYRIQFVLPLRTKIGIDFKKLDAKASQLFLTFNTSLRTPDIGLFSKKQPIYTGAVGLTGLSASIRSGLWIYSANLYFSESKGSISTPTPNFLGYIVRIKLNDLRFIHFYGAALLYNQGRVIPIPLLGFTYKLRKDMRMTLVIPVLIKFNYKFSNKANLNFNSSLSGFNSVLRKNSYFGDDFLTINYRHLKNYASINYKFNNRFKAIAEVGFSTFRKLSFVEANDKIFMRKGKRETYKIKSAPYAAISLHYNFGSSLFESKIDGID